MARARGALAGVLMAAFLVVLCPFSVLAEDVELLRVEKQPETVRRGATFSVILDLPQNDIAAFIVQTEYDTDSVEQVKAVFSDADKADYVTASDVEVGQHAAVYTARPGASFSGPLTVTLKTNADSAASSVDFSVILQEAADTRASLIAGTPQVLSFSIPFTEPTSADSTLLSLEPPVGTLTPAFDPEILSYALTVPFSSSSLVFDAEAAPGASVRVNRKNLGAGGSTTDFTLTVTAADGVAKTVYTVAVTRLEKEEEAPESSTVSKTSGTAKAAGTVAKATASPKPSATPKASASPKPSVSPENEGQAAGTAVTVTPETSARSSNIEIAAIVLVSIVIGILLTLLLLFVRNGIFEKYTPKHGNKNASNGGVQR